MILQTVGELVEAGLPSAGGRHRPAPATASVRACPTTTPTGGSSAGPRTRPTALGLTAMVRPRSIALSFGPSGRRPRTLVMCAVPSDSVLLVVTEVAAIQPTRSCAP